MQGYSFDVSVASSKEYPCIHEWAKFNLAVVLAASRGYNGIVEIAVGRAEFDVNTK